MYVLHMYTEAKMKGCTLFISVTNNIKILFCVVNNKNMSYALHSKYYIDAWLQMIDVSYGILHYLACDVNVMTYIVGLQ